MGSTFRAPGRALAQSSIGAAAALQRLQPVSHRPHPSGAVADGQLGTPHVDQPPVRPAIFFWTNRIARVGEALMATFIA
jgi:hypothetical protein